MTTKYFVDKEGNYLGGFSGCEPPNGAIEVPDAPDHAKQKWNGKSWDPYVDCYLEARNRLEKSDMVVIRCAESNVSVPAEWRKYRSSLRAIIDGSDDSLPEQPPYPLGT